MTILVVGNGNAVEIETSTTTVTACEDHCFCREGMRAGKFHRECCVCKSSESKEL